jgi:hypothetical protein
MRRIIARTGVAAVAVAAAVTCLVSQAGIASAAAQTRTPSVTPPPTTTSSTADSPICYYGACYNYVYGIQETTNTGASVTTSVEDPHISRSDYYGHSLQELAVMTTDENFIVEVGWTVDDSLNGNYLPHLFVYHWVDGAETCYNGCGFVQVKSPYSPGMVLRPGSVINFAYKQIGGNWWVFVNHVPMGYFPGSIWDDAYPTANDVEIFGEVEDATAPTCNPMGNGEWGTWRWSSFFTGYRLYGASVRASWDSLDETASDYYTFGEVTPTSFHLGGPGDPAAC